MSDAYKTSAEHYAERAESIGLQAVEAARQGWRVPARSLAQEAARCAREALRLGWKAEREMLYRCNRCHRPMIALTCGEEGCGMGACECGGLIEAHPQNFVGVRP